MFIKLSSNRVINSNQIFYYDDSKILISGEPNVIPIVTKDYQSLNKALLGEEDPYGTTIPYEIDTKINNKVVHGVINAIDTLKEVPNAYNLQLTFSSDVYSDKALEFLREGKNGTPISIEINSGTSYATKWTFMDGSSIHFNLLVSTNERIIVSIKYEEENDKDE